MAYASHARAAASLPLRSPRRPYHFESLPFDLAARLEASGAAFPLFHRAGAVSLRVEVRLAPGAGHERELAYACRRGAKGGETAEYCAGRVRFSAEPFDLAAEGGVMRVLPLRRALDAVYARVAALPFARGGRLVPLDGDLRPAWPTLLVDDGQFNVDLFSRAHDGGAALVASAGRRTDLRLDLRLAADAARLELSAAGEAGPACTALFSLRSAFLDAGMAIATRADAFAEALVILLARFARGRHPGERVTVFAPAPAGGFDRRELDLYDAWRDAIAAPGADPDLAAFDQKTGVPHGQ